jgi:hypothetical protein
LSFSTAKAANEEERKPGEVNDIAVNLAGWRSPA